MKTLLTLALLAAPAAAQDMKDVKIEAVKLRGGVTMLTGMGGNMSFCTGPDGVFLIDDQFAPLSERIEEAIRKVSAEPIRFLLNTHWHGDHTGGNQNFGRGGAAIVAHDNVRKRLATEQFSAFSGTQVPAAPKDALPVLTYDHEMSVHVCGQHARILHVERAHTDGDSIVHFTDADVIHAADVFFNGMYPFIDVPGGGSLDGMIAAGERVLKLAGKDTQIIPGHGALASREDLRAYVTMLRDLRAAVKPLVDKGLSREAVIAAKPTAKLDPKWGKGVLPVEKIVGFAYDSYTTKAK